MFFFLKNYMQKLLFYTKATFLSISSRNFFSEVNIHCDKVGQGDRTEGKKDKDIVALTDRSHMKTLLLCLPATHGRTKGTKEMTRWEKGEEKR